MGKTSVPREKTTSFSDLGTFAGVNRSTIYEWAKLPGFPIDKDGSVCKWDLCEWYIRRKMAVDVADVDGIGVDSPALERMRTARADIWEMEVAEKRNQLIPRAEIHALIMRIAGLFRGWTDVCQRQHGPDVYQVSVDVLEDIEREIEREFGGDLPDGDERADPDRT